MNQRRIYNELTFYKHNSAQFTNEVLTQPVTLYQRTVIGRTPCQISKNPLEMR